jgi:predicted nucleic acid-binding protein
MLELWRLLDTNILLRLSIVGHTDHQQVRLTIESLKQQGAFFAYTLQNLTEFWNVATRSADYNGFGLTTTEVDRMVKGFETAFHFLPDIEGVYREWRRLVVAHDIKGVQVHDARLAAVMRVYKIRHLLTLNVKDFQRYPDIIAVSPSMH